MGVVLKIANMLEFPSINGIPLMVLNITDRVLRPTLKKKGNIYTLSYQRIYAILSLYAFFVLAFVFHSSLEIDLVCKVNSDSSNLVTDEELGALAQMVECLVCIIHSFGPRSVYKTPRGSEIDARALHTTRSERIAFSSCTPDAQDRL